MGRINTQRDSFDFDPMDDSSGPLPFPGDTQRPGDALKAAQGVYNSQRPVARAKARPHPRVMVFSHRADRAHDLLDALTGSELDCRVAATASDAMDIIRADAHSPAARKATGQEAKTTAGKDTAPALWQYEAIVLDVTNCTTAVLRMVRELGDRQVAIVIVCPNVSFDEAVEAMRAGAADIVSTTIKPVELQRRVRAAIAQRRCCNAALAGDNGQAPATLPPGTSFVGGVPTPRKPDQPRATPLPTPAKPASTDKSSIHSIIGDFGQMIRSELDVETLLRRSLEFVLAHAGSTNAAVFLPSTSGDFSLGAYVNYTCPKETAEVLLDHLANVAAPRLENLQGLVHCRTPRAIREQVGDAGDWVEEGELVAFTCREGGETLAIFALFREKNAPFTDHTLEILSHIGPVFGKHLAKVVRIHHRHLPKHKWGTVGDPADGSARDGFEAPRDWDINSDRDQGGMAA